MGKYIPLDALLAAINKRITDAPISYIGHQRVWAYNDVKDIIDTLEVKWVNLEKEVESWMRDNTDTAGFFDTEELAKHFFKLGLKVNQDVDLELIVSWFDHITQIADDRKTANGVVMVDWAALDEIKCLAKESSEFIKTHYKAQKGE